MRYRLNVLEAGIDVYASVAYARIRFDRIVETNRIVDKVAGKLVNYQSAVIFMGTAQMSPNSPIKIKKTCACTWYTEIIRSIPEATILLHHGG